MNEALNGMTNKDLFEYCENEGIEVNAKNATKPTKTELLEAIRNFEAKELADSEEFLSASNIEKEGNTEEIKEVKLKKLTRSQKRKKQMSELMPLRRVIVTSNATNQTQQALNYVTWGNGLIGHQTDRLIINKPWHVREGALRNLENHTITEPVQDDEGNQVRFETKPAWNIRRLDPLTKEEINMIAKRQAIRDSALDSLI